MKERLKEILAIQSESYGQFRMFAYLIRKIKQIPCATIKVNNGNIYAVRSGPSAAPEFVPCVVAHMDTIHDVAEDLTVIEIDNKLTGFNRVTMKQSGIGGDDKVGVYIAMECLMKFEHIKVVFFRDEEVGCVGSGKADLTFFKDCSMVLQCDRRGNSDFITNACSVELSSGRFRRAIASSLRQFGYKFEGGMLTDVMTLKENGLKVSCANISCGYYNPHSETEYVDCDDVDNCLALVTHLIKLIGHRRYEHTYTPPRYFGGSGFKASSDQRVLSFRDSTYGTSGYRGSTFAGRDDWYSGSTTKGHDTLRNRNYKCGSCHTTYNIDDLTFNAELNSFLCPDCHPFFCELAK